MGRKMSASKSACATSEEDAKGDRRHKSVSLKLTPERCQ